MLVEFKFRNFKSFRDAQHFSMVASSDTSLLHNVASVEGMGRQRLIKSAAFYGANAAGKSNFVQALDFFQDYLAHGREYFRSTRMSTRSFLFQEDPGNPSDFEIVFVTDGVRYQYGFSLDNERVLREWLIAYPHRLPQRWIERSWTGEIYSWRFSPSLSGEKNRLTSLTRPDALFLSVAAEFNNEQLTTVYDWLTNRLTILPSDISAATGNPAMNIATFLAERESYRELITGLLKSADLGIQGITFQEKMISSDMMLAGISEASRSLFNIDEVRKRFGDEKVRGVTFVHGATGSSAIPLPFDSESAGTQRFYMLAGLFVIALRAGVTLIIDELDSSLHPTLVRAIVEMFNNEENQRNAQLIFNTHDTNLLDPTLFRRDQIWFVEKDAEGASHLYSLLEYRPRKGEALARGYLQGRYGAIPLLGAQFSELLSDAEE